MFDRTIRQSRVCLVIFVVFVGVSACDVDLSVSLPHDSGEEFERGADAVNPLETDAGSVSAGADFFHAVGDGEPGYDALGYDAVDVEGGLTGALLDFCASDVACQAGLTCELGQCVGLEDAVCFDDTHCSRMEALVCRPFGVGEPRQRCQRPGAAEMPCAEDEDCTSGRCGPGTESCAGLVGALCFVDGDCVDMLVCRFDETTGDRRCQSPGGACDYCDRDADCDGRTCGDGVCLAWLGEAGCLVDACCPEGSFCTDVLGTGTVWRCAAPSQEPGAYCDRPERCAGPLFCVKGSCRLPLDEEGCRSNEHCGEIGNVCLGGYCLPPSGLAEPCRDADGRPRDDLCAGGLICNSVYMTCMPIGGGGEGHECMRNVECGRLSEGLELACHPSLRICSLPGPPLADYAVSDEIELVAPGDSWLEWQCFPFPEVDVPDGYTVWHYVDTLTHLSKGEDDAKYLIRIVDGQACATLWGKRDAHWWEFGFDNPEPSVLRFRLNSVSYNPTLVQVETRTPWSPNCPADAYLEEGRSSGQACIAAGEYYTQVYLPAGFEGVGLIEPLSYRPGGSYMNFVSTVVSLTELQSLTENYIGIDVEHSLLFAVALNYSCDGFIGMRFHTLMWRKGLRVKAQLGHYSVRQPVAPVEQDLPAPDEDLPVYLTFFSLRSFNLALDRIQEDRFWRYCGSVSEGGLACDPEPPEEQEAFPHENDIEEFLSGRAGEGATWACGALGAPADICDWAGKGADWVVGIIFDALFDEPCGSGCDKDGQWDLRKERSGTGWTFWYDMGTGEGGQNDNCGMTVQILQLGIAE